MSKVHRMYRHSWWRLSKEITPRDYQAMCNFADEDISFETLAEHFCCTVAHVRSEIVLTESYGYRRRLKQDMNESVKMDAYQVKQWLREVFVKVDSAKVVKAIDIEAYLEKRYGPASVCAENIDTVNHMIDQIVTQFVEDNDPDYSPDNIDLVKRVLDIMLA